tara:strand:- start:129 stop:650 length:522 start_codon:yes stop_codon:yes gene_type:complete
MKKLLILLFVLCFKLSFSQSNLDYLLFVKINDYRISNGLDSWVWDTFIWSVANKHTQYQVKSSYMGHRENMDVKNHNEVTGLLDRFKEKNVYDYYICDNSITVAENVLVTLNNKPIEVLAKTMLQMWIDSPPHHETLLDPHYEFGSVSCLIGSEWNNTPGKWIYVTLNVLHYR